jgi:hypothetical protein
VSSVTLEKVKVDEGLSILGTLSERREMIVRSLGTRAVAFAHFYQTVTPARSAQFLFELISRRGRGQIRWPFSRWARLICFST